MLSSFIFSLCLIACGEHSGVKDQYLGTIVACVRQWNGASSFGQLILGFSGVVFACYVRHRAAETAGNERGVGCGFTPWSGGLS